MTGSYKIPLFFLLLWVVLLYPLAGAGKENKVVRVAVRAHSGTEIAMNKWQATADYLTRTVPGYTFELVPMVGFDEMRDAVEGGKAAFVLTNPTAYIDLEYRFGITRIATLVNYRGKDAGSEFGSVIFTRADRSEINTLSDIKGKIMMGVGEEAFGGWRMAVRELKNLGIDPIRDCRKVQFAGKQEPVVFAVRDGLADVGTVRTGIMERLAEKGDIDLADYKILNRMQDDFPYPHSTRLYPEWPFAHTKHCPQSLAVKVAAALFSMDSNESAAVQGRYTGWTVPLSYNDVHQLMRQLKAGPYIDLGHITFADMVRGYLQWIIGAIILLLSAVLLSFYFARINRNLHKSQEELKKAGETLESKVAERTADLSREVVKRRQSESELMVYRQMVSNVSDLMAFVDRDYIYRAANDAYCLYHDKEKEEIIGRSVAKLHGEETFQERIKPGIDQALKGKDVLYDAWFNFSGRGQRFASVNYSKVLDAEENIIGVVVVVRDMTEKKAVEDALHESEELFRHYFEMANIGFALTSVQKGWLKANQHLCNMLGYTEEELFEKTWAEMTYEEDLEPDLRQFNRMLAGDIDSYKMDKRFYGKGGALVYTRLTVSCIRNPDETVNIVIATLENISDEKKAGKELQQHREDLEYRVGERTAELEDARTALLNLVEDLNSANEKLKELDRLKSMFIASMSHELRTPLNSIIGFTGLIVGDMVGPISDKQRDMLSRVSRAGKHLLSLINDVIDIAKIESGKITPYPEDFPLGGLISEAVTQMEAQAAEKGLVIEQHVPDEPISMHTDRRRLLQCLLNYLSNAVKFSEKGTITVTVGEGIKAGGTMPSERTILPEGWLEISISDTGIGISVEDKKLLFGSFVRLETPLKTTIPGTGLGLYLTKKLATEVLGGRVGAESEKGKGSRFWLRMPKVLEVAKLQNSTVAE